MKVETHLMIWLKINVMIWLKILEQSKNAHVTSFAISGLKNALQELDEKTRQEMIKNLDIKREYLQ